MTSEIVYGSQYKNTDIAKTLLDLVSLFVNTF